MHILRRRGWELPERLVDAGVAGAEPRGRAGGEQACWPLAAMPAKARTRPRQTRNTSRAAALTSEKAATTYNNYYEFSESKNLWRAAQALKQRPWSMRSSGEMKQPRTIDIDDLLKQVQLEERVYRHRCVEAWAMTVPWTGFPLSQLLKIAEPPGSAKYVVFQTLQDQKQMPGLDLPFYPWPYIEGLTIDEAGQRYGVHLHRPVRQAAAAAERRPDPPDGAVEIRLQVGEGAGQDQIQREAAGEFLAGDPASGVWFLGQREPRGVASALEPGARAADRDQRDRADADLQRVW